MFCCLELVKMSHKEEQNQEIEALESIFADELQSRLFSVLKKISKYIKFQFLCPKVVQTDPFHIVRLEVKSENYKDDPENEGI